MTNVIEAPSWGVYGDHQPLGRLVSFPSSRGVLVAWEVSQLKYTPFWGLGVAGSLRNAVLTGCAAAGLALCGYEVVLGSASQGVSLRSQRR